MRGGGCVCGCVWRVCVCGEGLWVVSVWVWRACVGGVGVCVGSVGVGSVRETGEWGVECSGG